VREWAIRWSLDRSEAGHDGRDHSKLGRRAQVDEGAQPGLTTDERRRMRDLEKENRKFRGANEILKDASIFFATELDGRADLQSSSVRPPTYYVARSRPPPREAERGEHGPSIAPNRMTLKPQADGRAGRLLTAPSR
jgi:transposase-like protein